MYVLNIFVPEESKEELKDSLFDAGAGKYKNYDRCSWETKGKGQFRPLENSNPYIGNKNKITKVTEYKLEMTFKEKYYENIIQTIERNHPYEEPAYYIFRMINA